MICEEKRCFNRKVMRKVEKSEENGGKWWKFECESGGFKGGIVA